MTAFSEPTARGRGKEQAMHKEKTETEHGKKRKAQTQRHRQTDTDREKTRHRETTEMVSKMTGDESLFNDKKWKATLFGFFSRSCRSHSTATLSEEEKAPIFLSFLSFSQPSTDPFPNAVLREAKKERVIAAFLCLAHALKRQAPSF